jgi:hypothetical protein
MATNEAPPYLHADPELGPWRQVDWRYALGLFTTALFLLGAVTLFRLLLPNHSFWANVTAFAVTIGWRFGVDKLGFFPWTFRSRERHSSFSLPQASIEGFAFFVFMLVVLTFQKLNVSSVEIILAAVGGLVVGMYSGWYSPAKPIS